MKGYESPITWLMLIVFGMIFTVIGLFFLTSKVLAPSSANEQVAFANAEKLRSAIDEACLTGANRGNPVQIDFYLPQNKPFTGFLNIWKIDSFAKFRIGMDGDPQYVLYYEAFPPGEGIGWEVRQVLDYRAITQLPAGATGTSDIEKAIDSAKSAVKTRYKTEPNVLVSNVILPEGIDLSTGSIIEKEEEFLGKWRTDNFIFQNYFFLQFLNKTFIKYMPCGDNALCLKTRSGVYRYPLKYCNNIKYMQLIALPEDPSSSNIITGRYSDFYLASPCRGSKVKVYVDNCRNDVGSVIDKAWGNAIVRNGGCDDSITYPVYIYSKGTLTDTDASGNKMEHMVCLDALGGDEKTKHGSPSEIKCVRVELKGSEGFCYTNNPILADWQKILSPSLMTINYPVTETTDFMGSVIAIKPTTEIKSDKFLWAIDKAEWFWAWPGQ